MVISTLLTVMGITVFLPKYIRFILNSEFWVAKEGFICCPQM